MTFAYDPVGNRSSIEDLNGASTAYGYDAKSRLVSDTTTGTNAHQYTYAYDAVDNRIFSSETGSVVGYDYNLFGQLEDSTDGETYDYDENGNLILVDSSGDFVTMHYDFENRLHTHSHGADLTTFTYAADNLKRTERKGSRVTTLVWDGSNYLMEEN